MRPFASTYPYADTNVGHICVYTNPCDHPPSHSLHTTLSRATPPTPCTITRTALRDACHCPASLRSVFFQLSVRKYFKKIKTQSIVTFSLLIRRRGAAKIIGGRVDYCSCFFYVHGLLQFCLWKNNSLAWRILGLHYRKSVYFK